MDFDQLRQLDAIERLGTITAAARELHLSQSALSRSVRRLEEELGCELLVRRGRHVSLGEVGRVAVEWARQLLRDEHLMRDAVSDVAQRSRSLRVGSVAPAPLWRLTGLLVEAFPRETLTSRSLPQAEVLRGVEDGDLDVGIVLGAPATPALRSCELMREDLFVTLPPSHPLASRASLRLADLDGETFLLFGDVGFWRDVVERAMPHASFVVQEDRVVFEQLARTTPHCSFSTNAPYMANSAVPGRTAVPIEDEEVHAEFHLVVRREARGVARSLFEWTASRGAALSS